MEKIRLRVTLPGQFAWLESLSGRARSRLFAHLLQEKSKEELIHIAFMDSGDPGKEEETEKEESIVEEKEIDPSLLSRFNLS